VVTSPTSVRAGRLKGVCGMRCLRWQGLSDESVCCRSETVSGNVEGGRSIAWGIALPLAVCGGLAALILEMLRIRRRF